MFLKRVGKKRLFGFCLKGWLVRLGQSQMCRLRAVIEFQNILCGGEKIKTRKGRQ